MLMIPTADEQACHIALVFNAGGPVRLCFSLGVTSDTL